MNWKFELLSLSLFLFLFLSVSKNTHPHTQTHTHTPCLFVWLLIQFGSIFVIEYRRNNGWISRLCVPASGSSSFPTFPRFCYRLESNMDDGSFQFSFQEELFNYFSTRLRSHRIWFSLGGVFGSTSSRRMVNCDLVGQCSGVSFFLSFFLFYQTGRPILVDSSDMKLELGWKSPRLYFHVFISWMWGPVRIDSLVVRCRANWCMSYRFSSKKLLLKHSVSPSIFFLVQFFSFLKKELCWRVTWLRFGGLEKTHWNLFEPRCLSILTENETIVHESISARNWNAFAGR